MADRVGDSERPEGLQISVLVPTYRRTDQLLECLAGLEAQTFQPLEILAIVRPDDDETKGVLAAREGALVKVIEKGGGYVTQINASRAVARGGIIAFIDDDAVPRPDWLARIEEHFRRDPALGGLGGPDLQPADEGRPARVVGRVTWYGRLLGNHHRGFGAPRPVDVLKGVNMAYRASAIEGLEHDTRLLGEDMQPESEIGFCLRLQRRGWKLVYDPAVIVDHYPAVRPGAHQRNSRSDESVFIDAHNEFLGLITGLTSFRWATALAYSLIVGTRNLPGPLLALERMILGREGWAALRRMRAATRGRIRALSSARAQGEPGN